MVFGKALIGFCFGVASFVNPTYAQNAANGQAIAIQAGRLFDSKSGQNLSNQVILIQGERIVDVGPADKVRTPAGAQVIDLSHATVLPGLIDAHTHV